ncbi:hypothetical protein HAX54_052351, partial [Datura stramonium]|nr:hypothetical protein [Datura stramonium]
MALATLGVNREARCQDGRNIEAKWRSKAGINADRDNVTRSNMGHAGTYVVSSS